MTGKTRTKVAILQRVCTSYRLVLFQELATDPDLEIKLFIGEDVPNSKAKSAPNIEGVAFEKLETQVLKPGKRILLNHKRLIGRLSEYCPDIMICEGESNLLSYLKAIWYRAWNRRVRLVLWTLGGLPGRRYGNKAANLVRRTLWRRFDAIITYSSYGKRKAVEFGIAEDKVFVATNVCDTRYHLEQSRSIAGSKADARKRLGIDPDGFLALYVGAINKNKRLETLIDAAGALASRRLHAIVIGDGDWLERLKHYAQNMSAGNVTFPGRIVGDLPWYYKAADVFVLPGRGGIVVSESMAYGCPVIVYQADGTEYDLVEHRKTGLRLSDGCSKELTECLAGLLDHRGQLAEWGREGRKRIEERYNTTSMAQSVTRCIHYALGAGS